MAFEGGGRGRQIRIIYQIKHILINHICTHINFYWNYITLFTISKNKKNQYLDQSLVSAKFLLGHKNIQEIRIDKPLILKKNVRLCLFWCVTSHGIIHILNHNFVVVDVLNKYDCFE